jgi:general secretion pathway protein J
MIREHGFTLIEVLVSLVISAIVLAGVYASFTAVMDTRRRVEAGASMNMEARFVLTRLAREIESAFLVKRAQDAPPESRYTVFSGSQTEVGGLPGDTISFSTFAHTKRGVDARESDQAVIEYTVEEDERGPEVSGEAGAGPRRPEVPGGAGADRGQDDRGPALVLLRREWRRIPSPRDSERREPKAIALVDDIRGFRLRFRDAGGEWSDRWESTEVRTLDLLPTAVEITLTLRDGAGRDRDYVTVASPRIAPFERETLPGGEQGAATTTETGEPAPTAPAGAPAPKPAGAPSPRGGSR